jgi:hypothetical protein
MDQDADRGRVLRPRRWLVAAVVLAAVSVGVAASLLSSRPQVVELAALRDPAALSASGDATDPRPAPPDIPSRVAGFAPVRDGKPQWIATWAEGRAVAAAASKPIFAYVFHPECPACIELDKETFADAGVLADLEGFVPVKVDVMTLEETDPLAKRLDAGWPYLAAIRADEKTIHEIAGRWELADVKPELHRAAAEARQLDPAQPSWDEVREAADALRRGEELAGSGKSGEALVLLRRAMHAAPASGVAARATWEEAALRGRAQLALTEAAAGRADADALDAAAAEFRGSPEGDDLAAVARGLRATGSFPTLHEKEKR